MPVLFSTIICMKDHDESIIVMMMMKMIFYDDYVFDDIAVYTGHDDHGEHDHDHTSYLSFSQFEVWKF